MTEILILITGGYLLGSIPFGLLLTWLTGYGDIRKTGSGNIGATNVLRTGNKFIALLTLLLDAGKGALAIMGLVYFLPVEFNGPAVNNALICGLGAVLGHNFPFWLKFKGGKGVATTLGVFLAATPFTGLAACLIWIVSAMISRISSLSALIALASAPVLTLFLYDSSAAGLALVIALLGWIRHKGNIHRLIKGEEPKIGLS